MSIRLRVVSAASIALLSVWLLPVSTARGDNGPRQVRPAVRAPQQQQGPQQHGRADARRGAERKAANGAPGHALTPAAEARKRTQEIGRMRKRLDRDLLCLRRARIALLRCSGRAATVDHEDRVLVEVDRIRDRVARAAAAARKELLARAVLAARTPTAATRARLRVTRTSCTFRQVVVVERKRVVRLAIENARAASVLLEGPRRPAGEDSKRRVSDARRALHRLKKMGAAERRKIGQQLVRDARRIRKTQAAVTAIEKRMHELQRQIRALRSGKRARPGANQPPQPRPVPASAPVPAARRSTASD